MAIDRHLGAGEWEEAMTLWTGAFGEVGWIFDSLNAGTTDRKLEQTLVTEDGGKIVAAVDVFMREMRDEHGKPVKVGGIGSVATHADHRRKGHSGRLLTLAIDLMRQEGCAWSLLFTGNFAHYGRYGWVTSSWRKRIAKGLKGQPVKQRYEIEALGNTGPWPLGALAQIYATFNALRPMAHVRTDLYWDIPIRVRLERPESRVWIARSDSTVVGYLVAADHQPPAVIELGFAPGAEEAVPELLHAAVGRSEEVHVRLPSDPVIDANLMEMFETVEWAEAYTPMVRPIAPDWTIERIQAMTALPNAHCWELDAF